MHYTGYILSCTIFFVFFFYDDSLPQSDNNPCLLIHIVWIHVGPRNRGWTFHIQNFLFKVILLKFQVMPSYRRLQQYANAISVVSVIYNGLEGGLSIGFGAESGSRSLIFFGIQSGIEVISALLVLWRFRKIAKPGEERGSTLSQANLRLVHIHSVICVTIIFYSKSWETRNFWDWDPPYRACAWHCRECSGVVSAASGTHRV